VSAPTPLPIGSCVDMAAPPATVWGIVSDVTRMPEFSPELRKVFVVGRTRGLGQHLVGINRRRAVVWPTTSTIVRWEPGHAIAWKTRESGATWSYEIEPVEVAGVPGCRVIASRALPAFTIGSKLMVPVLGGALGHDEDLAAGLATTLDRIKAVVEA
jgi:hypothetical protein